jgi:hypothetical protein
MVENRPGVSATRPAKPVMVFDIEHRGQSVTAVVQAVCAVANTCQLPGFDRQRLDIQTPLGTSSPTESRSGKEPPFPLRTVGVNASAIRVISFSLRQLFVHPTLAPDRRDSPP